MSQLCLESLKRKTEGKRHFTLRELLQPEICISLSNGKVDVAECPVDHALLLIGISVTPEAQYTLYSSSSICIGLLYRLSIVRTHPDFLKDTQSYTHKRSYWLHITELFGQIKGRSRFMPSIFWSLHSSSIHCYLACGSLGSCSAHLRNAFPFLSTLPPFLSPSPLLSFSFSLPSLSTISHLSLSFPSFLLLCPRFFSLHSFTFPTLFLPSLSFWFL